MIKKFESFGKIDLEEVKDLIESEILDNYNSELVNIFIGSIWDATINGEIKLKKIFLPSLYARWVDPRWPNAWNREPEIGSIVKLVGEENFLSATINILEPPHFYEENIDSLSKSIEQLVLRIQSITRLVVDDISMHDNEYNAIHISDWVDDDDFMYQSHWTHGSTLKTNWENVRGDLEYMIEKNVGAERGLAPDSLDKFWVTLSMIFK